MKNKLDFTHPILRITAALMMAAIAWQASSIIPQGITYNGIEVGDVGVTVFGMERWLNGSFVYGLQSDKGILYQYPFTGMLLTSPLLFIPLPWLVPVFCTISTGILAYALLKEGEIWRYMMFVSIPYISSLHSAQWIPLLAASLIIPALLPLVVLKPHTALPLIAAGRWKIWTVLVSAGIIILSLILYPTWPIDWLNQSNVLDYDGFIPIFTFPGILLFALFPLWRQRRARLLLALSLMPQHIWYDQLFLFMVPESPIEMLTLVIGSWLVLIANYVFGWVIPFGPQDRRVHILTTAVLYLPALYMVLRQSGIIQNLQERIFSTGDS